MSWQLRARLRRRDGFPSWSWVGWVGNIPWLDVAEPGLRESGGDSKGWIVWSVCSGINCGSTGSFIDRPAWLHSIAPAEDTQVTSFSKKVNSHVLIRSLLLGRLSQSER
jgi:hypothetical protein